MKLKYTIFPLFFVYIPRVLTLECYRCHESSNGALQLLGVMKDISDECGNYDDSLLAICEDSMDACITVISEDSNGFKVKLSDCGTVKSCESINGNLEDGVALNCTSCTTDGCNNSPSIVNLSCYVCQEGLSTNPCNDFGNKTMQVCPETSDACITIAAELDGAAAIFHTCGTEKECKELDEGNTPAINMSCSSCQEDLCNISELRCYECTNGTLPLGGFKDIAVPCGSFDDSLLKTCPQQAHVCIAVTGHSADGDATAYSCGTSEEACNDLDGDELGGMKIECDSCFTPKCNKNLT